MITAGRPKHTAAVRLFETRHITQPHCSSGKHWMVSTQDWNRTKSSLIKALETSDVVEAFTFEGSDDAVRSDATFAVTLRNGAEYRFLVFQLGPFHQSLPRMPRSAQFVLECSVLAPHRLDAGGWIQHFQTDPPLTRIPPRTLERWAAVASPLHQPCQISSSEAQD